MALLDPIVLLVFFGALGLTYLVGRVIRGFLQRRRSAKTVAGPDLRSRQVKRAHKRQLKKYDGR